MTDWPAWHQHYDDPASALSRRLAVVERNVNKLVDQLSPRKVLSLCAGDGRDIIGVLAGTSPERRPLTVLVELDQGLAADASARAQAMDVDVTVVVGDAGATATWLEHVPVDLLMLCGIFGNICVDDIQQTIAATPAMVSPHGAVIWTRGAFAQQDLRPQIRQWFRAAGWLELAYEAEPEGFGVGVNQRTAATDGIGLPERLFTLTR